MYTTSFPARKNLSICTALIDVPPTVPLLQKRVHVMNDLFYQDLLILIASIFFQAAMLFYVYAMYNDPKQRI